MPGGEGDDEHIVPEIQMGPLMGDDSGALVLVEGLEQTGGQDRGALPRPFGQTVGDGFIGGDDAGARVGDRRFAEQMEDLVVAQAGLPRRIEREDQAAEQPSDEDYGDDEEDPRQERQLGVVLAPHEIEESLGQTRRARGDGESESGADQRQATRESDGLPQDDLGDRVTAETSENRRNRPCQQKSQHGQNDSHDGH